MNRTAMRWLAAVVALVWAGGCGGDEIKNPGTDADDTGPDVVADAVEDGADAVEDAVGDTADEETGGPSFESLFSECANDDDCEGDEVCFQEVCVRPPLREVSLWREEGNEYIPLDSEPDFSCWETPEALGEADPPEAMTYGSVDLFGPEARTVNLCVTAYDEAVLLRWMVWLDQNVCGELKDVDERDQVPYVNCFALDPCRCEDPEFTANRGDAGDSVEACYAEIGYCDAIEDAELQAQCRDNILERSGIEADTLIYGSTVSIAYPANPDRTEGYYEMEGVPTNTRLVYKVAGTMRRWRDTYEYGAVIPASSVDGDGRARWDTNIITDGAWRTIPQSAGIPEPTPPDRVAVAGVVRDCAASNSQQVAGARVGFVLDPVQIAYFNGVASDTLPQPGQADTNTDGVYAAISAPAGPNRVSVIAQQNTERVSAGVRDLFAPPYSVAIATFESNYE